MTGKGKGWMTTAELAARWELSPATLRNWRLRGAGPPYFKPSGVRGKAIYRLRDIESWEKKNTAGGRR